MIEMNTTQKVTETLDKALPSVEKITQAISNSKERVSEACYLLDPLPKLCKDVIKYSIHKSVNVTSSEANVKNFIDKLNRQNDLSASCLYTLRDFRCLVEFQKCSPEGKLLPVCPSVRTKAQECTSLVLDDKVLDVNRIKEKNCFAGFSSNSSTTITSKPPTKIPVEASKTSSSSETKLPEVLPTDRPKIPASETKTLECNRRSYLVRWNNTNCFEPKLPVPTKNPSINPQDIPVGKIDFVLYEDSNCIDTLKLLQAQVEQSCSCDTKIGIARAPCGAAVTPTNSSNTTKIISFREVEYLPGLEKHLNFFDNSLSFENTSTELHDPLYFERFYYRTCDRLIGVPEVYSDNSCKLDDGSSKTKVYMGFKNSTISTSFRSGCTRLECLSHLRYMPAVSSKPNVTIESNNVKRDSKKDSCQEKISECPAWDFNSEGISIGGYPPKITSFLELDVQAFPNSSQPAIIFSFRALAQPLYEGLRFLLNGVPAMEMVYNQTSFKGYAVPLVPGKVHIARWEFVRGDDIGASSINYADIQSIILRESAIVNSDESRQLKQNLDSKNTLVHLAPEAPIHLGSPNALLENSRTTASISAIIILFTLMTGVSVAGILLWFWTQHKKSTEGRERLLSPISPRERFRERDAQFSFIGKNPLGGDYTRVSKDPQTELELDTFVSSESRRSLDDE